MSEKLNQLFKNTKDLEPSLGLEGFILAKIKLIKTRQTRRKLFFTYAGLLGSIGAFFWAVASFSSAFFQSEFWNLTRLAFSDAEIVAANWKSYSLSLLETLPVVEIIAILIPVFAILMMLNVYFKISNKNHYKLI